MGEDERKLNYFNFYLCVVFRSLPSAKLIVHDGPKFRTHGLKEVHTSAGGNPGSESNYI